MSVSEKITKIRCFSRENRNCIAHVYIIPTWKIPIATAVKQWGSNELSMIYLEQLYVILLRATQFQHKKAALIVSRDQCLYFVEDAMASRQTLKRYFLLNIFFELMNLCMWNEVKRGIRILRTTVSTRNAPITRQSWHLQSSLEKQRNFMILSLTYEPMSIVCCYALQKFCNVVV